MRYLVFASLMFAVIIQNASCTTNSSNDEKGVQMTWDYNIFKASRADMVNRKRMIIEIIVPYEMDWEKMGMMTKAALFGLERQYPDVDVFNARLTFSEHFVGMGVYLALGDYAKDGKGWAGDEAYTWKIKVISKSNVKPTKEEFSALENWYEVKSQLGENVDKGAEIKKIADEVGLSKDEVGKAISRSVWYTPSESYLTE